MNQRLFTITSILCLALVILLDVVYVVKETEKAILLRFGALVRTDISPGLHFKVPIIDNIRKFSIKLLTLDSVPETFLTLEEKPLLVDSFVKWRVLDVAKYYTSTSGDRARIERLLHQRINEGLRNEISSRTMFDVVSGERDQLMEALTQKIDAEMRNDFGVLVVDVRVKLIELSSRVSESVFERMRTARDIVAKELRAKGKELATGIRADADRKATIILANAYRDAQKLKGDGDAKAASIYAGAYSQNRNFYKFYRSLSAYQNTLQSKSDVLVLDPKSEFFEFLKSSSIQ